MVLLLVLAAVAVLALRLSRRAAEDADAGPATARGAANRVCLQVAARSFTEQHRLSQQHQNGSPGSPYAVSDFTACCEPAADAGANSPDLSAIFWRMQPAQQRAGGGRQTATDRMQQRLRRRHQAAAQATEQGSGDEADEVLRLI